MIAIAGLLAFVAWWLKTWRSERLRPALIFLTEHVSGLCQRTASWHSNDCDPPTDAATTSAVGPSLFASQTLWWTSLKFWRDATPALVKPLPVLLSRIPTL
jgi:hypothetical protein